MSELNFNGDRADQWVSFSNNNNNMDFDNQTEFHQLVQENKDLLSEIEHLRQTVDRKEAHIQKLKFENKVIKNQIKKISTSLQQVCLNHDEQDSCSSWNSHPRELSCSIPNRKRHCCESAEEVGPACNANNNEMITISDDDDDEQEQYSKRPRIIPEDSQLIYSEVVPETPEDEQVEEALEISPSLLVIPDDIITDARESNDIIIYNEVRKQGTPKNFIKFIPQILVEDQYSRISLIELSHVNLEFKVLFSFLESCSAHIKSLDIFNFKLLDKIPERKIYLPNLESFSLRGGDNIISILLMDFGTVDNRIDSFISKKVVEKLIFFTKQLPEPVPKVVSGGRGILELNTHITFGNLDDVLLEINPKDGKIMSKLDCTAELFKDTRAENSGAIWNQINFISIHFNWSEIGCIEESWLRNLKVLYLEDDYNICELFKLTSSPELNSEERYGRRNMTVGRYISPFKTINKLKHLNSLWLKYRDDHYYSSVPLSLASLSPNPMLKTIILSNITVHLDFFPKSIQSWNLESFGFDKCKYKGTSFSKYLSVFNPKSIAFIIPKTSKESNRPKYFERIRGIFNYGKIEGSSLETVKLAGFTSQDEINNVLRNYIGVNATVPLTTQPRSCIIMNKSKENVWSLVPSSLGISKDIMDFSLTNEFLEWKY